MPCSAKVFPTSYYSIPNTEFGVGRIAIRIRSFEKVRNIHSEVFQGQVQQHEVKQIMYLRVKIIY